jgi:hypothetical protein
LSQLQLRNRSRTDGDGRPRMARAYWTGAHASRGHRSDSDRPVLYIPLWRYMRAPWPVHLAVQCSGVPLPCPCSADADARGGHGGTPRTWGASAELSEDARAGARHMVNRGTCQRACARRECDPVLCTAARSTDHLARKRAGATHHDAPAPPGRAYG